jgi:hypothetical protein
MGFGKPSTPAAKPEVPVPQPDDPETYEARKRTAARAAEQKGSASTLLSQGVTGTGDVPGPATPSKRLLGE